MEKRHGSTKVDEGKTIYIQNGGMQLHKKLTFKIEEEETDDKITAAKKG